MPFLQLSGPPKVEELVGKNDVKGLIKALDYQKDSGIRKSAAHALANIGDASAVEPLVVALKDDDMLVGGSAARAVARFGEAAVEPLIRAIAWGVVGGKEIPNIIVKLRVRNLAEDALVSIGEPAVEPLLAVLEDNYGSLNQNVANALARIGDARAVDPLVALLTRGSDSKRWIAARTLGTMKATRAVEPLIAALGDSSPFVRRFGAESLGEIGDTRAVGPLLAIVKDPDADVRANVSSALEMLGHTS